MGLRSFGKGANRTILDCLFGPDQPKKPVFCRRGGRGRRQPIPLTRGASFGTVPPVASLRKGLGS